MYENLKIKKYKININNICTLHVINTFILDNTSGIFHEFIQFSMSLVKIQQWIKMYTDESHLAKKHYK